MASFFPFPEGPIFPLLNRRGTEREKSLFVAGRLAALVGLAWLPLLLLSWRDGFLLKGAVQLPLIHDFAVHARLLLALPLFLIAGRNVTARIEATLAQFTGADLLGPRDVPRFEETVRAANRWVNVWVETLLILALAAAATQLRLTLLDAGGGTWESGPGGRTAAGWWYVYASRPIYQFVLFRWLWRIAVWDVFLFKASRLPLRLIPTHPDRCAGLAFLGAGQASFSPFLLGLAFSIAADAAERILFAGASLQGLAPALIAVIAVFLAIFLAPLVVFAKKLLAARRVGLLEYGSLAGHYVRRFHDKWTPGRGAPSQELLGTPDLQSLADLINDFAVIQKMRLLPIDAPAFTQMALAVCLPFVPLLLTRFTPKELFTVLKGILL